MSRRLISTRRRVRRDRQSAYRDAWSRLVDVVEARGGHAWVFRSTADAGMFMEFIEYADGTELVEHAAVAAELDALEAGFGVGERDDWIGVQ